MNLINILLHQIESTKWKDIIGAVDVVKETGFPPLDHVAHTTYLIKRAGDDHVVRHLEGLQASRNLSSNVKLRGGMFNNHMPWGYAGIFKNCGGDTTGITLDLIARS